MNMKKKALLFAALPVLAIALLAGGITHASTTDTGKHNPFTKIAEAIATKFNLSASDVQTVIDETMKTERADMEKNRPMPLELAVKNGKLTQAQADLIKGKMEEIKTTMDSMRETLKNTTQAEREAAMKTQREALKQWATDNNIPEQYIMFAGGHGPGRGGERGPGGPEFKPDNAPTSETTESSTSN